MWMRLKLMAPFQSPRDPRFGFSSPSLLPWPFRRDLAMAALRLHQRRFTGHRGLAHLLAQGGAPALCRRLDRCPGTGADRTMYGFDDRDVDQSFEAGGFGRTIGAHGLREMHELGRELVALGEFLALLLLANRELIAQSFGVLEGRIDDDASLGADDLVTLPVRGAVAPDVFDDSLARDY